MHGAMCPHHLLYLSQLAEGEIFGNIGNIRGPDSNFLGCQMYPSTNFPGALLIKSLKLSQKSQNHIISW